MVRISNIRISGSGLTNQFGNMTVTNEGVMAGNSTARCSNCGNTSNWDWLTVHSDHWQGQCSDCGTITERSC